MAKCSRWASVSGFRIARALAIAACFAVFLGGTVRGQDVETDPAGDGQAELEQQFQEMLSGATLVGHFTVTGREGVNPREERYDIESIEKLPNGRWMFRARIRYGDHDVTVPLPIPVEWAGNTPVIVVDELQIPGLGTYSARVLFFEDHYAGYWSGGDHGGHLFGVIERNAEDNE